MCIRDSDGAGTDIYPLAYIGVADIGQVIGLGAGGDPALLDLDKIANMHLGPEFGSRAQAGEGADHRVRPDHRIVEVTEGRDPRAGADRDIVKHAIGANLDGVSKLNPALEDTTDIDEDKMCIRDRRWPTLNGRLPSPTNSCMSFFIVP